MDTPKSSTPPGSKGKPADRKEEPAKENPRKELNVVSIPHDDDLIADEMAELFEEDQVTHKHGSSEPEGD